jgi:hypothetical protein
MSQAMRRTFALYFNVNVRRVTPAPFDMSIPSGA